MNKPLACLLLGLFLFPFPAHADAEPLRVVATFSILGDMVRQVGGDRTAVQTLVANGEDAHIFKPTPAAAEALARADLVVENGLGFEGWIVRLVSSSGYKGPVLVASDGVMPRTMQEDGENVTDPHAWQDVSNARIYVKNIAAALGRALPQEKAYFDRRAEAYDAELGKLDRQIKADMGLFSATQRKLITSHDAFGYFGAAYGVSFLSPQGINTEIEPTAAQVAALVRQMKEEKVRLVFFEALASPRLISTLAKDAGARVGKEIYSDALSGPKGPAQTYADMMRYNAEQFKEALSLNGR